MSFSDAVDTYCAAHKISEWKDITKLIANAQEENYEFGKTWRGAKCTDVAGAKYSFGITNVSAFASSQATNGISLPVNAINEGAFGANHYAALSVGSAVLQQLKTRVMFNGNDAANTWTGLTIKA
jgi:hypothetical protein